MEALRLNRRRIPTSLSPQIASLCTTEPRSFLITAHPALRGRVYPCLFVCFGFQWGVCGCVCAYWCEGVFGCVYASVALQVKTVSGDTAAAAEMLGAAAQ